MGITTFGEASLRHALTQYVAHFHHERNHQGKSNVLLFPAVSPEAARAGPMQCRERLGGLLKYYAREAAWDLKVRWGVSLQALIRRARTLECLTPSQYRSLSAQLGARGWRTQEPIAVPVERPRALRQLAELLYGRPIRAVPLADAMGLAPSFVQDLLEAHAPGEDEPHTTLPDHARR